MKLSVLTIIEVASNKGVIRHSLISIFSVVAYDMKQYFF